jgi:hypothetical protein
MIASARRDAPVRCPICERKTERRSRQQVYCSRRCMRRANYARKAGRGLLSGQGTALVPTPPKSVSKNNSSQPAKTGSSLFCDAPLNLLGGGSWKWPRAGRLDRKTFANICWSEIGGDLVPVK